RQLVIIDQLRIFVYSVWHDAIVLSGEVERMTVRQVAAMRKVHSENRVARLQDGQINGHVGLASRMWLDVHMLGAEKFFGAFNRQILNDIRELAAAVVAAAGISFGIFIGDYRC